jgi:hypothetical protein
MGEQFIGQSFGLGAKLGNGVAEVDRIPEDGNPSRLQNTRLLYSALTSDKRLRQCAESAFRPGYA